MITARLLQPIRLLTSVTSIARRACGPNVPVLRMLSAALVGVAVSTSAMARDAQAGRDQSDPFRYEQRVPNLQSAPPGDTQTSRRDPGSAVKRSVGNELEVMRRELESMRATLRVRSAEAARIAQDARRDLQRLTRSHSKALVKLRVAEQSETRLRARLAAVRAQRKDEATAKLETARADATAARQQLIIARRAHAEREFRLLTALEDAHDRLGTRARRRPLQVKQADVDVRGALAAATLERDEALSARDAAKSALQEQARNHSAQRAALEEKLDAALAQLTQLKGQMTALGATSGDLSGGDTAGLPAAFAQARRLIGTLRTDVDRTERELRAMRAKANDWFERWRQEHDRRQQISTQAGALRHKLAQAAWRLRHPNRAVPAHLMRGPDGAAPTTTAGGLVVLNPAWRASAG
ncbi:MAG: hypothetical protein AAFO79_10525, partial [Pseudomonadota bacterium]